MSKIQPQPPAGFQAEVLSGAAPPGRQGTLEIKVRWRQGKIKRGPAQLVSPSGGTKPVNVLGITQVTPLPHKPVDAALMMLGITGAVAADIVPGSLLVQS
jgi:hypothetical protein